MTGARGYGDLGKALAGDVLEHAVGDEHGQAGVAGAEIEVEIAVVVKITEVASHRGEAHVQTGFPRDVLKTQAVQVAVELAGRATVRLSLQAPDDRVQRVLITDGEDVQPAVVVVVKGPAGKSSAWSVDPHPQGDVTEGAVAVVVVEA